MVDDSDVVAYCRPNTLHPFTEPGRPDAHLNMIEAMLYHFSCYRRPRRDVGRGALTGWQPNCRPAPAPPGMALQDLFTYLLPIIAPTRRRYEWDGSRRDYLKRHTIAGGTFRTPLYWLTGCAICCGPGISVYWACASLCV